MKQLTDNDVIKAAGGWDAVTELGDRIENRYLQSDRPIHKWLREKLATAHFLNLHKSKNKKIIDIGTGAGWFPFICKLYGHDCLGTDEGGRPQYDPVYEFLDIPFEHMLVYPNVTMQLDGKYDYITAHRAFFPQRPRSWEKDEWKFFLDDARTYLNNDGGLFLGCNAGFKLDPVYRHLPKDQVSHWGNKELGDWFAPYVIPTNGKEIKNATLYIPFNEIEKLLNT